MNSGIYHGSDCLLYVKAPNLVPAASSAFATDGTAWWSVALATLSWDLSEYMILATASSVKGRIYKDFLVAGKTYNVKFRFKSVGYTGKLDVYIGAGAVKQSVDCTSAWQDFDEEVAAVTDGELSIELNSAYTGDVSLDDIIVQRTDDDIIDYTVIGHATSHDVDIKGDVIIRKTKSTGEYPTRKLTGIDASLSLKALVLYDGYSFKDLLAAQLNGDTLMTKLAGHDSSLWGVEEDAGDWYLEMPVLVSNNSGNWAVNEDGSYSCSFDLSGELTIQTVA